MSKLRVLIVDDDRDSAELLRLLVELGGHEARALNDARSALMEAAAFRPDAAFLDIGLPDIDGFELGRALRQTPGVERVLLVAITGFDGAEDKAQARQAGFDHFIVKPLDPDEINRLLSTTLS